MSITPVELHRFEPVSDELVLAALERAQRHRGVEGEAEGVFLRYVAAHLAFVHNAWTTRHLRPQLEDLTRDGLLSSSRLRGKVVWSLTEAGRLRLAHAQRAGRVGELPESPQHRDWRHARAAAQERIGELRRELRAAVAEAGGQDVERTSSDAWFELGERLQRACRSLGSATYCLREWPEPDDAHAEVDERCDPGDSRFDPEERARMRFRRTGRRASRWR
jgi:DNA-binding PadR family transcriptional regulator